MPSQLSLRFGIAVRDLRKKRGWQQVDLAAHAGLSRNHVSGVELGQREVCLNAIARIAEAFELTPAQLLHLAQRSHGFISKK